MRYMGQLVYFITYNYKIVEMYTPKSKYKKYSYKVPNTSVTDRSICHYQPENMERSKKESRTKIRKQSTQNPFNTNERKKVEHQRFPLEDISLKNNKRLLFQTQAYHQKINSFSSTNGQLQSRIKQQEKEIEQLRLAVRTLTKQRVNKTYSNEPQKQQLKSRNYTLYNQYEYQSAEMEKLKKEINSLKAIIKIQSTPNPTETSQLVQQSKVSLRRQYVKHYETNIKQVQKASNCQHCQRHQEEIQDLRAKYGNQLRRLEQQVTSLKQKKVLVEVMDEQIQNKNECIDYLRKELQRYQRQSKDLLNVVFNLENKLKLLPQNQGGNSWQMPRSPFQSFSQYNQY